MTQEQSVFSRFTGAGFIGFQTTLCGACERAIAASRSETPVYIWGERGVGKETFARAIGPDPVVKLNCGLVSAKRWSELLSDEPGCSSVPYWAAGAGALLFTEIDALSKPTQRRLAARIRDWSPRVVLTSSRSYMSCRAEGLWAPEFDELLTSFPICLPPLRDRQADLRALALLFLREEADRLGVWKRDLSERELTRIEQTEFPENLDDLRALTSRIAQEVPNPFEAPKQEVREESSAASERVIASRPPRRAEQDETVGTIELTPENFPSLEEAAVMHIEAALRLTNGVVEGKTGAAELLKINPYTLRSRMRKMKLDWTKFRQD